MGARLGQHFLVCAEAADAIVHAAGLAPGEAVVEIGPGRGVLTERMLLSGISVTAVELDRRLCAGLSARFPEGLTLLHGDFLKIDLAALPRPCAVVSNLPYAVAAPILQRLLDWPGWDRAVLMFQKEVAERILAGPGSRKYGPLTLSVLLKAEAEPVRVVPRTCFSPRPRVDSAVVRLRRLARPRLAEGVPEDRFFKAVGAAFQHRRKTVGKSMSLALGIPRSDAGALLARAGLSPDVRAEDIPFEGFASLAKEV
ncbi:MAG: 16S rRNA (adenine(1518)-N(6)/adenine(1519)-N(6))-dimethyltransferase RsmA [Elusimicrobiota bacterium]